MAVNSAQRALAVFEEVVRHQPVALTDIARNLDAPLTTVHRALQSLSAAGWVRQVSPGKRWIVTARIEALVGRRHAELAGRIRDRKVGVIEDAERRYDADVVASANPGCAMHLAAAGLTVAHPLDLVAEELRR